MTLRAHPLALLLPFLAIACLGSSRQPVLYGRAQNENGDSPGFLDACTWTETGDKSDPIFVRFRFAHTDPFSGSDVPTRYDVVTIGGQSIVLDVRGRRVVTTRKACERYDADWMLPGPLFVDLQCDLGADGQHEHTPFAVKIFVDGCERVDREALAR